MNHALNTAHTLSDIVIPGDEAAFSRNEPGVRFLVDFVSDAESFDAFRRPMEKLAEEALEPALAAGFAWSKAALAHIASDDGDSGVVLVWRYSGTTSGEVLQLVGAFTQMRMPAVPGFSLQQVSTWNHLFSFSGAPLVHRDHAAGVFEAYLNWALNSETGSSGLRLEGYPAEGPLAQAFDDAATALGLRVRELDASERAVLDVPGDLDAYLTANLPRKKRKEFRRLHARLREQGVLEFSSFGPGDDLTRWLNDFYALEGRGWKGRGGTALSCDPDWSGFFDVAMGELAQAGEALVWKLTLDDTPVAMVLGGRNGRQVWLFKIAFDEDYAKYSPGVLVILEIMKTLCSDGDTEFADSCAQPDHPMINSLWRERLGLHSVMVGRPGPAFALQYHLARARREGRAMLKRFYLKFIKGGAR